MSGAVAPFSVLAVEEGFIVVDKAPGVPCQREGNVPSILDYVSEAMGTKVYLVHRLDRMTSGLLLLATSTTMNSILSGMFRRSEVEKYYLALSVHRPSKKQGAIIGDMKSARDGSWMLAKTTDNPAITQFFSVATPQGLRLFVLKPGTGKTHQLRVALRSLGAPILGDSRYCNKATLESDAARLGLDQLDRGYLHAYGLRFRMGATEHHYMCMPRHGQIFLQADVQALIANMGVVHEKNWPEVRLRGPSARE